MLALNHLAFDIIMETYWYCELIFLNSYIYYNKLGDENIIKIWDDDKYRLDDIYSKEAVTMEIRDEEENKIKTNLDYSQEYMKFANSYYKTGIYLVKDILHNRDSPRILDTVFPVAIFLMRQEIELLCKALILEKTPTEDALLHFKKNQHDLYNLWRTYQNLNLNISEETSKKLSEYFENINVFDKNSDLWRYPLFEEDNNTQEKIAMLEGRIISIERTFGSLNNAFNMLLNLNEKPQILEHYINFINENEDALINTHLWEDYDSREHYVGRVLGYIEAAKLTYSNELSIEEKEYPLFYLLRQGIELLLKDYLASNFKEVSYHHHIGFAKQGTEGKVISDLRCRVSPYRQCDLNIIGECSNKLIN